MVALARDGADVVSASRYMRGGHQVGGPLLKRLMSRTAGLTLHWFAGVPTHDPTNNFKLYSRRFLDAVTIESTAGFELALELTVKATLAGRTRRRGPDDLARPDGRPEQLQAPQVAAALPRTGTDARSSVAGCGPATAAPRGDRALPARVRADRAAGLVRRHRPALDREAGRARHRRPALPAAASTWLAGGDPWTVTEAGIPYAAGPHTLLFYAPTSVLPLHVSRGSGWLGGVVAAVWLVRRLELPSGGWPSRHLLHGVWNGNPQTHRAGAARPGQPGRPRSWRSGLKLYAGGPAARAAGGIWSSPSRSSPS